MHDSVNHPDHYTSGGVECIEAIEASMSIEAYKGFLKGNCMKYLWRYEQKGKVESLLKCQWYLERLIMLCEAHDSQAIRINEQSKKVAEYIANHDPDDYMISGCPDGFCPMPSVRQGPPEMFKPVN